MTAIQLGIKEGNESVFGSKPEYIFILNLIRNIVKRIKSSYSRSNGHGLLVCCKKMH